MWDATHVIKEKLLNSKRHEVTVNWKSGKREKVKKRKVVHYKVL